MRKQRQSQGWNAGYFIREGFFSIFKHGLMSFAAICMIVACLLIMGTFTLVAWNMEANLEQVEAENEFLAYVDESYTDAQAQALESQLLAVPNIRDVVFVSRTQALEDFLTDWQDQSGLFDDLPESTLRHRYRVHVVDIEELEEAVKAVGAVPGIADTEAWVEVAEGMVAVRNVAAAVALILVGILALVSLFIIANTLRLAAFYRRDEVAIMKMCGATNRFICWPYVTEGLIIGLFSSLAAFGFQWLVYDLLTRAVASTGPLGFLTVIPFADLWKNVLLGFTVPGLVIGVLGSLLAIRRFLKV